MEQHLGIRPIRDGGYYKRAQVTTQADQTNNPLIHQRSHVQTFSE